MQKSRFNVALSLVLAVAICLSFVTFLPTAASAASSANYYSGITATEGEALLGQLHDLITTTHKRYTSYDDCKNITYVKQTDGGSNSNSIMDFYSQSDLPARWDGGTTWNREHVWCQSLSAGMWGTSGGGSDMHHIRPLDSSLNSTRGNNKFGETHGGTPKYTKSTGALGGYLSGGTFEPLDNVKGDVARIVMYVYTHYNTYSNVNGTTNGSGSATFGTLRFTNVISASSESAAIEMLLEWNRNDPVDSMELNRNEAVYDIQGNRNPFVDNEAYADAIWGGQSLQTDPLQSLQMNYSQLTLSTQQTMALKVTATPSNANSRVTWTSSNSNVASVSSAGVVTGVSAGTATITATSVENSSITARCSVTVKGITGISISGTPSKTTYTAGETFDPTGLTVTATYNDGTSAAMPLSSCKWLDGTTQSENLSQGTTSVLCKVGNLTATVDGITVTADATIPQPVDMTNLQENTPYKLTMKQGNKSDIILYIKNEVANNYYMASTENPTESDDVYVQNVSGGFQLYFLNGSTKNYLNAEVSGTHVNLVSQTSATTVWQYDAANKCIKTAVTVSGSATEAYIGTYNYYTTFSTSTIDRLSGAFPAYLTAYSDEPTPTPPTPPTPGTVTLNRTSLSLTVGASATLTATASGTVSWTSSDSSVVTVSSSGRVTAVGSGTATVTATCGNAKATCTVIVTSGGTPSPSQDFVTLDKTKLTLTVGETSTLTATASGEVTWTTSDSRIAAVSDNGKVTAVGKGTAVIKAKIGTEQAICTVTVTEPEPDSVTLNKTSLTIEAGETSLLSATANGQVVWTSSDESIATVSSSGRVAAQSMGTATITVTCGTATATCTVTVTEEQGITAFVSAVAQAEQATAFDVKYQALQQAISAYSNLSQNAKNSVQDDYAKLQNAVNAYNQTAARYNGDANSALGTVLTTAVTLSLAAAAALVVILKQKLL